MTDLLSSMLVDIVTSCAGSLLWRSEFMLDNRCWQQFMDCFLVFCPLCTNVIAVCGIFRQLNKLFFCSVDTHNFFFFFARVFPKKESWSSLRDKLFTFRLARHLISVVYLSLNALLLIQTSPRNIQLSSAGNSCDDTPRHVIRQWFRKFYLFSFQIAEHVSSISLDYAHLTVGSQNYNCD